MNQIRVPSDEIDDLLDLAAWYGSTRISPFVTSQGGWRCFRKMIKIQPEPSSSASNLAQIDQSITMSQFERTIQVIYQMITRKTEDIENIISFSCEHMIT